MLRLACVLVCAAMATQAGAGNTTIAVMDLYGHGVAEADLGGLSDRLRAELHNTGRFTVVERTRVHEILAEQGFQQTGCTNAACAVEIGQLVGVRKIALGSVSKVGAVYSTSIRLVDVASGKVDRIVSRDCQGCNIGEVLTKVLANAAADLAGLQAPSSPERAEPTQEPAKTGNGYIRAECLNRAVPIYVDDALAGRRQITKRVSAGFHKVAFCSQVQLDLARRQLAALHEDEAPNPPLDKMRLKRLEIQRMVSSIVNVNVAPGERAEIVYEYWCQDERRSLEKCRPRDLRIRYNKQIHPPTRRSPTLQRAQTVALTLTAAGRAASDEKLQSALHVAISVDGDAGNIYENQGRLTELPPKALFSTREKRVTVSVRLRMGADGVLRTKESVVLLDGNGTVSVEITGAETVTIR